MVLNRLLVLFVVYICTLIPGLPLSAQYEPGQWVGDLYFVRHLGNESKNYYLLVDEKNIIQKTIPNLDKDDLFPVPPRYRYDIWHSCWYDGALYALASGNYEKNEDGSLFERFSFARWKEREEEEGGEIGEWQFLGDYKSLDTKNLLKALPCDNSRFIVISHHSDLTGNTGADRTPFVRMSIPSGGKELRIDSPIYHGQDDLAKYMTEEDCFDLAWLSYVIATDKYATLINPNTGLYWCFSLEKARLIKAGNIFRKVTPEMIAKGGFPNRPVLCINPEKDGTVLIAAQVEDFFIATTENLDKEIDTLLNNGIFFEDAMEYARRRHKELAEISPIIEWYRIYPENGKVEKLLEPPKGGSWYRDGGKNDHWRPMPDGSIQMVWLNKIISEKVEKTGQEGHEDDEPIG